MQKHRHMINTLQMNKESKNWFRLSNLIIDVGAEVLQHLVEENIQTYFLNEFEYVSLEKVQKVRDNNYAAHHWHSFRRDLTDMDETSERSLTTLHKSWKLHVNQTFTFSEQVSKLQEWEKHIETHLDTYFQKDLTNIDETCIRRPTMRFGNTRVHENQNPTFSEQVHKDPKCENSSDTRASTGPPNAENTLLSWLKQIQDSIRTLMTINGILQRLTASILELCQQSRKDLLGEINTHYTNFLFTSKRSLLKAQIMSKEVLKEHINNLESKRKEMQKSWKKTSNRYFNSLRQNIKDLFTKFERNYPLIVDIPELKKLLEDLDNAANEIDETELQKSCDAWHQELHNLFGKLLRKIDNGSDSFNPSMKLIQEFEQFRSIRSQQVKDFFFSEVHNTELQKLKKSKQISEKQYTTLCPSSAFPDINKCDTTLLVIILKSCLLYPPTHGWNEEPSESDQSIGADILRLKSFRNDIVKYIAKTSIVQKKFDKLWLKVQDVLCRLAFRSGEKYESEIRMKIDQRKTSSLQSKRESELIRILNFCRNDILAEFKGLAQTHECLKMLESIESVEMERLSRMTAESDLPISIPQGLRAGWQAGNEIAGPAGGAVLALGGGVLGFAAGIRRTIFNR